MEEMKSLLCDLRNDLRAGFAVIVFLLVLLLSNMFYCMR